jgi:hypothetical protein
MENSMETCQKLKIELPYDQAIPVLWINPKECNVTIKAPKHSLFIITKL